tara:strand:- start:2142 stop:4280 length:2139 start_codon:yes stop_codon:yes gene_type:complete
MIKDVINNIQNRLITVLNGNDFEVEETLLKYFYHFNNINISSEEFLDFNIFLSNNPLIKNKIDDNKNLTNHEKFIENFKDDNTLRLIIINSFNLSDDSMDNIIHNLLSIRTNFSTQTKSIKIRFLLLSEFNYQFTMDRFTGKYGSWPLTKNDNHFYISQLKIDFFDLHKFNKAYNININRLTWTLLYNYTKGYIFDIEFLTNDISNLESISIDKIENACLPFYKTKEKRILELTRDIEIKNDFFSIKTKNDILIDKIYLSNIFKLNHTSQLTSIFKPKNYFSEFCLNRYLYDNNYKSQVNYPAKHTIEEHVDIFQAITRYEQFFKNKIISINQSNNNVLENIIFRLYSKRNNVNQSVINEKIFEITNNLKSKNSSTYIKKIISNLKDYNTDVFNEDKIDLQPILPLVYDSPNTVTLNLEKQNIKEWGVDETKINNSFNGLTFGELKIIYQKLSSNPNATIYKVDNSEKIIELVKTFFNQSILLSQTNDLELSDMDDIEKDLKQNETDKSSGNYKNKTKLILNPINSKLFTKLSNYLYFSNKTVDLNTYKEENKHFLANFNIMQTNLKKAKVLYVETKKISVSYKSSISNSGQNMISNNIPSVLFKCTFFFNDIYKKINFYEKNFVLAINENKEIKEMIYNYNNNDESGNKKLISNSFILGNNNFIENDIKFIEMLRLYRNAISHNKKLSEDSIREFYKICDEYIESISNESK